MRKITIKELAVLGLIGIIYFSINTVGLIGKARKIAVGRGERERQGIERVLDSAEVGAPVQVQAEPQIISKGEQLKLPGLKNPVYLSEPIFQGAHFTWREATKNGARIPRDKEIVDNIIGIAREMEGIRAYLGNKPITVNSWYRDVESNRDADGAKNSQHLKGRAVDFTVQGMSPEKIYGELDKYWGDKGGVGKYHDFTHVDNRGKRARW